MAHQVLFDQNGSHVRYWKVVPLLVALLTLSAVALADHFVGFSEHKVTSDQGLVGLNEACQQAFESARVCNSREILDTAWRQSLGRKIAWVHPVIVGTKSTSYNQANQVDYSGLESETLSCAGWKSRSKLQFGLAVDGALRFHALQCGYPHYVACCGSHSGGETVEPQVNANNAN